MDRYKFRGKRVDNGEWVYGYYFSMEHTDKRHSHQFIIPFGADLSKGTPIEKIQVEVDPKTVWQFTGLYDSTKWESLSDSEKKLFYDLHCSDDGRTIKFNHPDDAKRLWKGREIYEGDILKCKCTKRREANNFELEEFTRNSVIEWWRSFTRNGYRLRDCKGKTMMIYPSGLAKMEAEVIGNIHDNPLEVKG